MSTPVLAAPTCAVVFDEPTEWVDRSLPTASWWDRYEILPGTYPFEWVTINHRPWNPDPDAHTSGFLANVGPYYGLVRMQARLLESYRVNRLLTASSAERTVFNPDHPAVCAQDLVASVYAYQLIGCPTGQHGAPLTSLHGGRVEPIGAP